MRNPVETWSRGCGSGGLGYSGHLNLDYRSGVLMGNWEEEVRKSDPTAEIASTRTLGPRATTYLAAFCTSPKVRCAAVQGGEQHAEVCVSCPVIQSISHATATVSTPRTILAPTRLSSARIRKDRIGKDRVGVDSATTPLPHAVQSPLANTRWLSAAVHTHFIQTSHNLLPRGKHHQLGHAVLHPAGRSLQRG